MKNLYLNNYLPLPYSEYTPNTVDSTEGHSQYTSGRVKYLSKKMLHYYSWLLGLTGSNPDNDYLFYLTFPNICFIFLIQISTYYHYD